MVKLRTKPKRGGVRKLKKLTDAQALLLKYIWEAKGGVEKVARTLEIHPQALINWRLRGRVPLREVNTIANKLSLHAYAFNFVDMTYFGGTRIKWDTIVEEVARELNFTKAQVSDIKNAKAPVLIE